MQKGFPKRTNKRTLTPEEHIQQLKKELDLPSVTHYSNGMVRIHCGGGSPDVYTNDAGFQIFDEALKKEAGIFGSNEDK